jgi:hypothetical protein
LLSKKIVPENVYEDLKDKIIARPKGRSRSVARPMSGRHLPLPHHAPAGVAHELSMPAAHGF